MEIRTAQRAYGVSGIPAKNQVCRFWLQGRCNRNPCKFMHRESPPPPTEQPPLAPHHDMRPKQPRNMTWKNPHCQPESKKGLVDQSTLMKVLKISRKNGLTEQVDIGSARSGSRTQAQLQVEKSSPPSVCKYWVTDNCVHGDKCKHLHSWFCGSGFTMLTKLEGHKEVHNR